MMPRFSLLAIAAKIALPALLLSLAPMRAQASTTDGLVPPYHITYSMTSPDYAIDDIVLFERTFSGWGSTNSFAVPAGSQATAVTDPFTKVKPIIDSFIMGVTTGLPGDADGQLHLVLGVNNAFANQTGDIAFGTFFPYSNEDALVADLIKLATGLGTDVEYNELFDFARGDGAQGPAGPIAFATGDDFTLIAFSDLTVIGSGQSSIINDAVDPPVTVPEPMSFALLGIGVAGLAAARRRGGANLPGTTAAG